MCPDEIFISRSLGTEAGGGVELRSLPQRLLQAPRAGRKWPRKYSTCAAEVRQLRILFNRTDAYVPLGVGSKAKGLPGPGWESACNRLCYPRTRVRPCKKKADNSALLDGRFRLYDSLFLQLKVDFQRVVQDLQVGGFLARHIHCVSFAITSWLHQLHRKAAKLLSVP